MECLIDFANKISIICTSLFNRYVNNESISNCNNWASDQWEIGANIMLITLLSTLMRHYVNRKLMYTYLTPSAQFNFRKQK